MCGELIHRFDPTAKEPAFASVRSWEMVSRVTNNVAHMLDNEAESAVYRGLVGCGAGVQYQGFLKIWRELDHPQYIIDNPTSARIPTDVSALIATCGSLHRAATPDNFDSIVVYAKRLRPEIGEFLVNSCAKAKPALQQTTAYTSWVALNLS